METPEANLAQGMRHLNGVYTQLETCSHCGGAVKIIACIEDPMVIEKILTHLNKQTASAKPTPWHESGHPLKPSCLTHRKDKSTRDAARS